MTVLLRILLALGGCLLLMVVMGFAFAWLEQDSSDGFEDDPWP